MLHGRVFGWLTERDSRIQETRTFCTCCDGSNQTNLGDFLMITIRQSDGTDVEITVEQLQQLHGNDPITQKPTFQKRRPEKHSCSICDGLHVFVSRRHCSDCKKHYFWKYMRDRWYPAHTFDYESNRWRIQQLRDTGFQFPFRMKNDVITVNLRYLTRDPEGCFECGTAYNKDSFELTILPISAYRAL